MSFDHNQLYLLILNFYGRLSDAVIKEQVTLHDCITLTFLKYLLARTDLYSFADMPIQSFGLQGLNRVVSPFNLIMILCGTSAPMIFSILRHFTF